jgi:hypothetical protein
MSEQIHRSVSCGECRSRLEGTGKWKLEGEEQTNNSGSDPGFGQGNALKCDIPVKNCCLIPNSRTSRVRAAAGRRRSYLEPAKITAKTPFAEPDRRRSREPRFFSSQGGRYRVSVRSAVIFYSPWSIFRRRRPRWLVIFRPALTAHFHPADPAARQNGLVGRYFPSRVITAREPPSGSSTFLISSLKLIALMMPSPNFS